MDGATSSDKSGANSSRHKCAACKYQRRRCAEDCALYPYFPTDRTKEFTAAHAVFGVKNMTSMLTEINLHVDRKKAVDSLVWEANAWAEDPVNGPLGLYKKLQQEKKELESQLQLAKHQTTRMSSFGDYGGDDVGSCAMMMMNPSGLGFQSSLMAESGGNNSYDFQYYQQRLGHQLIPSYHHYGNGLQIHQQQVLPMSIPRYNPSLEGQVNMYKDDAIDVSTMEGSTSTGNQGQ